MNAEDGGVTSQQTGLELMPNYSERLSARLQSEAARSGLDTAEMAELTQWASTVMVNPSQNSAQRTETMLNGLKASEKIMSDERLLKTAVLAILQAHPAVRYASVLTRPNGRTRVVVYTY